MIVMIKAWLLSLLEKCVSEYASNLFKRAKTEGYLSVLKDCLSVFIKIKNKIKRGNVKMANTTITVQNSTGTILYGVTVSYLVNAVKVEGTTDTNGQLVIAGLDAGTYTFTAAVSGYTSASVDLTIEDADIAGTITLTAETTTTEGVTTLSTITDELKETIETAAIASLVSTTTTATTSTSDKITAKIKELSAEISTTKSEWVKIRNTIEIAGLAAGLAGITAGLTSALKKLTDK